MTKQEALAEAQKRWGPDAFVSSWRRVGAHGGYRRQRWCYELFMMEGDGEERGGAKKGSGDSWESAFADADRRAK